MKEKKEILKELQVIPGVGKSIANDLYLLGIRSVSDLKNKSPEVMYDDMTKLTGSQHDICLLYVFRCAVYFSKTKNPEKKKLDWWYWKNGK
ncbi:MAG TPA: pathogenicity locus [Bacteroidetes bacterium]|nr:pathogenicity locus [Bacteroidota bacterium]